MNRQELSATVLELLEKETGESYPALEDATSLRDGLNLDSLDMAGLVLHIESRFGIQIETELLEKVTTVGNLLDVLRLDYVTTARSKGLDERVVIYKHALRNALIPVLTIMGLQFGNLITGAIVIENVFVLPGLGRLVFQAIANRDLVLVRDVVMLLAALVIAINLVVDLATLWVDPRLRGRQGAEHAA